MRFSRGNNGILQTMGHTLAALMLSLMGMSELAAAQAPAAKQVLVVLSESDSVSLKEGGKHRTGYFLSELAGPAIALKKAGYQLVFATPGGKAPVMDPISDKVSWFKDQASYNEAKALINREPGLKTPKSLTGLSRSELEQFSGIFVPGGHAPMEDLYRSKALARVLEVFHNLSRPTALICHGPVALLSTRLLPKGFLYGKYKMTVFSTAEEKQEETPETLGGHLFFYPQDELSKAGGSVTVAAPWTGNAVRDKELITGQNPMSEEAFTRLFLKALAEQPAK